MSYSKEDLVNILELTNLQLNKASEDLERTTRRAQNYMQDAEDDLREAEARLARVEFEAKGKMDGFLARAKQLGQTERDVMKKADEDLIRDLERNLKVTEERLARAKDLEKVKREKFQGVKEGVQTRLDAARGIYLRDKEQYDLEWEKLESDIVKCPGIKNCSLLRTYFVILPEVEPLFGSVNQGRFQPRNLGPPPPSPNLSSRFLTSSTWWHKRKPPPSPCFRRVYSQINKSHIV